MMKRYNFSIIAEISKNSLLLSRGNSNATRQIKLSEASGARNSWVSASVSIVSLFSLIYTAETGSEDIVLSSCDWLFKINLDIALEALKKHTTADPFKSERVLNFVKDHGQFWGCLKYLEYLTLECLFEDQPIHTELGCLYVELIKSNMKQYVDEHGQLDIEKANLND